MKKILIFIIIFLSLSLVVYAEDINECKTDIYFGNGVWNDPEDAEENRLQLEIRIINKEIIKNRVDLAAKYGEVKLQYNWGQSWDIDLVETFYQLKEAGQLSEWAFFALMDELLTKRAADITGEDLEIMRNKLLAAIIYNEQSNVDDMLTKYYNESFKWGHRVLLVSHSQGNLFANRVYDSINPSGYKNYFANVQVASPASSVHADKGTYVTGYNDPIINPIPGSMPSNAVLNLPGGHAFVEAYLDSKDSYDRIVKAIKGQLDSLDKAPSQWRIDKEPNKCESCKSYVAAVSHIFDTLVSPIENVLPYQLQNYKLYAVQDRYVLASCGGHTIEDMSQNEESKLCSKLLGTDEVIPKMETLIDGVCIGIVDSDIDYRFDKDNRELLVGSIGDNYWVGSCTHYKRHITLMVENHNKLHSFRITEIGFDDWIELGLNLTPFYTSPYALPSNCELGTSFVVYPDREIVSNIKEGINKLDMHVIVTGGGEGWFKVKLQ